MQKQNLYYRGLHFSNQISIIGPKHKLFDIFMNAMSSNQFKIDLAYQCTKSNGF